MNYGADKVTLPSVRGISQKLGTMGLTTDPEPATKKDVTAASQNFTFDASLLGKWVTFEANGATVWLISGAVGDAVTAVATGPCVKLLDGQLFHALISKATQKIGFISTGNVTGGLLYWPSARDD